MNGSYTPRTLPVGGEEAREVSPRSLAEALLVKNASNLMQSTFFYLFVVQDCGLCGITPLTLTVGVR